MRTSLLGCLRARLFRIEKFPARARINRDLWAVGTGVNRVCEFAAAARALVAGAGSASLLPSPATNTRYAR